MASKKLSIESLGEVPDVVKKKYDNGVSDWIGVQKTDTNPILYLSGTLGSIGWEERAFKKITGCGFRCFSYAYAGVGSPLSHRRHTNAMMWCLKHGVRCFLDSGGHTFHKLAIKGSSNASVLAKGTGKESFAEGAKNLAFQMLDNYVAYVKWCYLNDVSFDFYVTMDWVKNCPDIYAATQKLFKRGIHPVPVFHGDHSLYWFERYVGEGHKIIGVSVNKLGKNTSIALRRYYSSVFNIAEKNGVKLHGFAVTGDLMLDPDMPFYSVDSTTWLKAAAFGKILDVVPEKQRVALIHVSDRYSRRTAYGCVEGLSADVQKALAKHTESRGFDFQKLREDLSYRAMYNAKVLVTAVAQRSKKTFKYQSYKSFL